MMNVIQGPQDSGQRVQLLGVTGDQVSTEITDVVFPILTQVKKPYTLTTKGTTLVLEKSKDNILSLADLYKAGFNVTFAVGTPQDPTFGGVLTTPTGTRGTLVVTDNLWRVPMWSPSSRVPLCTQAQIQIQPDVVPIVEASPAIISTAKHAELKPSCSSQDRKSAATIRNVISTLQKGGANDAVDLNLIIHGLQESDIQ